MNNTIEKRENDLKCKINLILSFMPTVSLVSPAKMRLERFVRYRTLLDLLEFGDINLCKIIIDPIKNSKGEKSRKMER